MIDPNVNFDYDFVCNGVIKQKANSLDIILYVDLLIIFNQINRLSISLLNPFLMISK